MRTILISRALFAFAFLPLAAHAQTEPSPSAPPAGPGPAPALETTDSPSSSMSAPPSDPGMVPSAPSSSGIPPEMLPPEPSAPDSALAADGHPLAGWHNGRFYLRDRNDNFRLYPQGRAHLDAYAYAGPGVSDTGLKPTLFIRRIRPEVTLQVFKRWWFTLAGDFGQTGLDNSKGTNETSAAAPGAVPSGTSGRYASAQTARVSAAPADVYAVYKQDSLLHLQLGQFDAPFTMENRTTDKETPFMERALTARTVGIPTNKEMGLMAWGETENHLFYYSAGIFNGDGQNRLNPDNRGDGMARVWFHPLSDRKDALKDLHIGASFRYGMRQDKSANYDYAAMTTQGNYTYWSPVYSGAAGATHILPQGAQLGVGGELRVPYDQFDLQSEFVYIHNQTREALEGYQASNTERTGEMKGHAYHVQVGYWIGKRDVHGMPGVQNLAQLDFSKVDPEKPARALQLLLKWEQVRLNYASASRGGTADAKNVDGDIKLDALSVGANYWATKYFRLTLNYVVNMFPDSAPSKATAPGGPVWSSVQRAQAPGNTIAAGVNNDARDTAHLHHEIGLRVGGQF